MYSLIHITNNIYVISDPEYGDDLLGLTVRDGLKEILPQSEIDELLERIAKMVNDEVDRKVEKLR
jgi:hypothetical protein